jgi:thiol-disulfide isomerase/thioredoxin
MQMRKTVAVALMLFAVLSCKRGEQKSAVGADKTTTASGTAGPDTTSTAPVAGGASEPTGRTEVGATMPEYTAVYLDGSRFDLGGKGGKVVLLNVWATWCGPCRFEIPELQKIHEQYAPRGLEVVGVSLDERGAEDVRPFVTEQKKMTYPIVLDPDGKIAELLETGVLPTSVLVDRRGKIVWRRIGAIMEGDEELKKAIELSVGG